MDHAMKQSSNQFHEIFFSYLKMFSVQYRKNTTVEDNKKKEYSYIYIYIYIYTNIYTYILCDKHDLK